MLDIILVIVVILVWSAAMVWAYWNNCGMEDFKKSFKKMFDKNRMM